VRTHSHWHLIVSDTIDIPFQTLDSLHNIRITFLILIHTHIYIHTYIHRHTHTHTHTYIQYTHTHTHTHTHTYTHTYTHTHTHTHTHKHTHTRNEKGSIVLHAPLSIAEGYRLLEEASFKKNIEKYQQNNRLSHSTLSVNSVVEYIEDLEIHTNAVKERQLKALFFRIRLNAFTTKFSKDVKCLCGEYISNTHIILECEKLKPHLPAFSENSIEQILNNVKLTIDIAKSYRAFIVVIVVIFNFNFFI